MTTLSATLTSCLGPYTHGRDRRRVVALYAVLAAVGLVAIGLAPAFSVVHVGALIYLAIMRPSSIADLRRRSRLAGEAAGATAE